MNVYKFVVYYIDCQLIKVYSPNIFFLINSYEVFRLGIDNFYH
jgi:hypothetical protein